MPSTENLGLPFLEAGQAQKHVTLNEALRMLDALVQLSVRGVAASPPDAPENGWRYIVGDEAVDEFEGRENQIAIFEDGAWRFFAPKAGWIVFLETTGELCAFDGAAWVTPRLNALQEIDLLGVGTSADETNPFAAKLNNLLFTARETGEGGSGDLRFKVNKQSSANTASLLFQAGYSGRAEVGLIGGDDFRFKVSADGSVWRDGVVVAAGTGRVSFPQGATGVREMLTAPRTYYVRPDGDDANDGLSDNSGGAFATIQKAVDVVYGTLDLGGFNVTIQVADGTYAANVSQQSPQVGAGRVIISGNVSNPENVVVGAAGIAVFQAQFDAILQVQDLTLGHASVQFGLQAATRGAILFSNLRFGSCSTAHIRASDLGYVNCMGNYAIVGSAPRHFYPSFHAVIRTTQRTITLTGTPNFSVAFAHASVAGVGVLFNNTFSGAATGQRYFVETNGFIDAAGGGASYFPGNADGTTATGGQYV